MDTWDNFTIGELATFIKSGGTPSRTRPEYFGGDIPWLTTKEIDFNTITDTEQRITEGGLSNSSAKWVPKGATIVAMYGATAGKVCRTKIPLTTNQACCNILLDPERGNDAFLYYQLFGRYHELVNLATGAAQQNLSLGAIRAFPISLPPLAEQQAIAEVLSSLDDKIDLLKRQNKTLEGMAEALFRQWFIEEAQDDWEEVPFGEVFDFTMGQSPPGTSFNEDGFGIPMYQGNADFGMRFPSARVYTTEPKRIAKPGDVLMSVRAPVGAMNMAKETCCIGRGVAAFRLKEEPSYDTYTMYQIKAMISDFLVFNEQGTVFGSIGKSDLHQVMVTQPPFKLIEKFESEVGPMDHKIRANANEIGLLEKQRDTLLPKLMSGEVRVNLD